MGDKRKMKKYRVKRPKDTVEVLILPNKDGSGYQYVNLTKGHICPCRFKTESEALRDMDKKISEGKVLYYEDVEDFCHNELHTYPQHDEAIEHFKHIEELEKENAELKAKIGLSIDCEKAQKNGDLCLGYGGDEDEPCERCKNCIKCEGGYYQLGETDKDDQLTKVKDLLLRLSVCLEGHSNNNFEYELIKKAEQFLKED